MQTPLLHPHHPKAQALAKNQVFLCEFLLVIFVTIILEASNLTMFLLCVFVLECHLEYQLNQFCQVLACKSWFVEAQHLLSSLPLTDNVDLCLTLSTGFLVACPANHFHQVLVWNRLWLQLLVSAQL